MGNFLAATSLRDAPVRELVLEVESWFSDRFVVCTHAHDGVGHAAATRLVTTLEVQAFFTSSPPCDGRGARTPLTFEVYPHARLLGSGAVS